MMKQLNSIDQNDPDKVKDQPILVKLTKHFEPIRKDRLARTPPPPPALHHEHRQNHQQFLHVANGQRSPSPNLISPRFNDPLLDRDLFRMPDRFRALEVDDDIEQRMRRFRLEADFDRNMPQFK
jgi:hypothetical protein